MTPRHRILAALTLAIAVAFFGSVGSAGKSTYYGLYAGYDSSQAVRSDGSKSYTFNGASYDYSDGVDNTQEALSSDAVNYVFDLQVNTAKSAPRLLCFDFTNAGGQVPPLSGNPGQTIFCRTVRGGMLTVDNTAGVAMTSLPCDPTTTAYCNQRRYHIGWVEGGFQYHFAYGRVVPDGQGGTVTTAPVTLTCQATGSKGCTAWQVTPDSNAQATLSRQAITNGKLGVEELVGTYYMPFTLSLALK